MSRTLKLSGFLGLTVQMAWGLYNIYAKSPMGPGLSDMVVGAHSHFGALGILAVVLGLTLERYDLSERRKKVIWGTYIAGQWLLPWTLVAISLGATILAPLDYLWGLSLLVAMALTLQIAWN